MTETFRVALSSDFRRADGSLTYPDFDIGPLQAAPDLEVSFLKGTGVIDGAELAGVDALILLGRRFEKRSINPDGRLAVVARFGVGYDNVDVAACTEASIALVITPDGVRRPVAVSILTLMLALTGRLAAKDRLARLGPEGFARRSEHMGVGLVGRVLGSLGVGNIGAELFRLVAPLGMKLIAHDPYADPKLAASLGVELVPIDDLFALADVLSINCPLTPATRHIVDARLLGRMKRTAFLINTARGEIIDQKALVEVLREGRIAGAGLDVFEKEPPDADDPLLALPNVVLTPHALCWTDQCFAGNGAADVKAVLDLKAGREPVGIVNRAVTQDPRWRRKLQRFGQADRAS